MIACCMKCDKSIDNDVYLYSLKNFKVPLCRLHQAELKNKNPRPTIETLKLYYKLLKLGIPAHLHKEDGFKTIDIAIPKYKLNIEVDGVHHNWDDKQALKDLQRDYYSFTKGYYTLHIPNSLVRKRIDSAITYIINFLNTKENG